MVSWVDQYVDVFEDSKRKPSARASAILLASFAGNNADVDPL
jgi:hypothetical protein